MNDFMCASIMKLFSRTDSRFFLDMFMGLYVRVALEVRLFFCTYLVIKKK
jgi:hypothetical protein